MVFGVCVESDCDSLKRTGVGLGLHRVGGETVVVVVVGAGK